MLLEGLMLEGKQQTKKLEEQSTAVDRFAVKARLNLNDLLKRRMAEKKVDKKTNYIIFSGVSALAVVVLLILSL